MSFKAKALQKLMKEKILYNGTLFRTIDQNDNNSLTLAYSLGLETPARKWIRRLLFHVIHFWIFIFSINNNEILVNMPQQ